MVYLHVYFNDTLQEQLELNKGLISIGRSGDNDLQIDNPGVSAHHARIVQEAETWFIEDTNSTNGTSVNGEPVSRKQLEYGDKISIFKHTLKFSPLDLQEGSGKQAMPNTLLADGAGTVEIDVSRLDKLLKQQIPDGRFYLQIHDKDGRQRKRPLTKASFKIGKDPVSDLLIRGWFVPRIIASIDRRADAYYVVPGKGGNIQLNGQRLRHAAKLDGGDILQTRGIEIVFVIDEPESPPA